MYRLSHHEECPRPSENQYIAAIIRTTIAYLALKVIVTSEQKSTRNGEGHGSNTADGLANLEE
jgi:hypothetical protein